MRSYMKNFLVLLASIWAYWLPLNSIDIFKIKLHVDAICERWAILQVVLRYTECTLTETPVYPFLIQYVPYTRAV